MTGSGPSIGFDEYNYYNEQIAFQQWAQTTIENTQVDINTAFSHTDKEVKKNSDEHISVPAC